MGRRRRRPGRALPAALLAVALAWPAGAAAQRGVVAAAGVAGAAGSFGHSDRDDDWGWGVALAGRIGYAVGGRAGVVLLVDYQAFRVESSGNEAPYRALFLIPSFTLARREVHLRVGVGTVGLLREGAADDEWGVAVGALVTRELPGPWTLEMGWRQGGPSFGKRASLYSLSLLRSWSW